ncbi:protein ANTAGONIST OF LIKE HETEROCHROMATIN PROTEIN 1-like, partial [Aphis craccivora]
MKYYFHICSKMTSNFENFFRISRQQFDFLLSLVELELTKLPSRRVKDPISAAEKLAVTLRYMATGESLRSLSFGFRICHNYISRILKKTLAVLKAKLIPIFLKDPKNVDFKGKAAEFSCKWNFPNCILAIDGKHIRIRSPKNSGSLFHNYKDFFYIVLLAMVDANYKFIVVDIGSYGKEGDSGIFLKSTMGKQILNGSFGFPEDSTLPVSSIVVPHVIVGDGAFRLHKHIMKPYTKKAGRDDVTKTIFNYRLSRARRFLVFYQPINLDTSTCEDLIWVLCCLHNMLRTGYMEKNNHTFYDYEDEQSTPTNNMLPLSRGGGFINIEGFDVRERFKSYFNNEGSVPWQF